MFCWDAQHLYGCMLKHCLCGWYPQAQETWSLLVAASLLLTSDSATLSRCLSPAKAVLLAAFCLHYFYRCAAMCAYRYSQLRTGSS